LIEFAKGLNGKSDNIDCEISKIKQQLF
jgi:hypothetical protein